MALLGLVRQLYPSKAGAEVSERGDLQLDLLVIGERLVVELRDRLQEWQSLYRTGPHVQVTTQVTKSPNSWQEAESALISLGYKPQEAAKAVTLAAGTLESEGKTTETAALIRLSLKNLGRSAPA